MCAGQPGHCSMVARQISGRLLGLRVGPISFDHLLKGAGVTDPARGVQRESPPEAAGAVSWQGILEDTVQTPAL